MKSDHLEFHLNNLRAAAKQALELLAQIMGVDTLFIAANDRETNYIIRALNRRDELIKEGSSALFLNTYCSLVISSAQKMLLIPNTKESALTGTMEITKELGQASFIGVPIVLPGGEIIGTICGLDNHGYEYSEKDVAILESVAKLFSYVVGLEHLAFRDGLTEAYTRDFLAMKFSGDLLELYKNIGFMFLDLDNFKIVNDTHGHKIGDEVLKIIANRIQSEIRQSDYLARIGGDEFLVIVADYGLEKDLERIASSILQAIRAPINTSGISLSVSASIGISTYPIDGISTNQLVDSADGAMYEAKALGKNTYCFT